MTELPEPLMASLKKLDHFDEDAFRKVHSSGGQVISIRFNPSKIQIVESWPADFLEPPFKLGDRVPWSSQGFYLSQRPSFTLDPLFHSGAYYVQEASGMFLEQALRNSIDLSRPLKVLDLCAAPGGKSTLIQSLISKESMLLSNEVIKTRVPVLHQNMSKWGLMNGLISNNDPKDFRRLPGYFDVLFIDAPCSGSGLFRKDPIAIREWSEEGVRLCSQRQQRILADAWDCLKENGVLIYATCSFSREENEDITDYLLTQFGCTSIQVPLVDSWNIVETRSLQADGFGYRFYPDKLNGEGFFLAVFQKKTVTPDMQKAKGKSESPNKQETIALRKFIPDEGIQFIRLNEWTHAMQAGLLHDFNELKNHLYLKKAGVMAGRMGLGEWIPGHELALSTELNPLTADLPLSRREALTYLRRETLPTVTMEKGWKTVSFGTQKLGWVKILADRINNYFPKSWRILK